MAIGLLLGCAKLPIPAVPGTGDAKSVVKKAATVGTVEVLDVAMEKSMDGDQGIIKVTGSAIYHPAKVGAKAFKDYGWAVKVSFYDDQGKELPFSIGWLEYGDYWKSENVIAEEPFPFKGETSTPVMTGHMDTYNKASSCKVTKFACIG